jgi:Ca2+-transporting ATPase
MSESAHHGLTDEEARKALALHGRNEIRKERPVSPIKLLLNQFRGPMTALLIAALAISAALKESADAAAIGTILVLNALMGFFQEYRAEKALKALRSMTAPRARVLRDGHSVLIPAAEVVPGDFLILEAGDVVAADALLTEANQLKINEAILTGESHPVTKEVTDVADSAPLAERTNRAFMGTPVASGTGVAEVVSTGMATELGKIAHLLAASEKDETPLQKRLTKVSRSLFYLCLAIVLFISVLGFARGESALDILMYAVSLAVAAVPEGLPAIVTIALAVGIQRMAARHVLVRKLPAVETLGCATVICTDKTGTLTAGVMAARESWGSDERSLLYAAAACCDAELDPSVPGGGIGDPTEIALLESAEKSGIKREDIEKKNPRRSVTPFDSATKRMSVRRADGKIYMKGALEALLPLCERGADGATEANEDMAKRGLRVLAVAEGTGTTENELTLLGLFGIADPPRPEAVKAVAAARKAGIKTVMITGDHPVTARAIGRELGIVLPDEDPAELIHARASAKDKIEIVREWKSRGQIVAMTGDGVNDAPAIRAADVGIAMGKTGTEVTREASDMILLDDNFASIVAAVKEGRGTFENIRKTLVYLLTGNAAELFVMFGAALAGLPPPLLPLHLLWINLVTDGLPSLTLVMDPAADDALNRPPRDPNVAFLGRSEWLHIVLFGLVESAVVLTVYSWRLAASNAEAARDAAFSVLVFSELLRAFSARSPSRLFWEVGVFSNLRLLGAIVFSVALQIALHHVPPAQSLFRIGALSLKECLTMLTFGLIPVSVIEIGKLFRRGRNHSS